MLCKYAHPQNPSRTMYVGNLSELLRVIGEIRKEMIARHGQDQGQQEFGKLKAKDLLDMYAVQHPVH